MWASVYLVPFMVGWVFLSVAAGSFFYPSVFIISVYLIYVIILIFLALILSIVHFGVQKFFQYQDLDLPRSDFLQSRALNKTSGKLPLTQLVLSVLSLIMGLFIILSNAPRTYEEDGLIKTAFVSLIFFLSMICLPCLVLLQVIKYRIKKLDLILLKLKNNVSFIKFSYVFRAVLSLISIFVWIIIVFFTPMSAGSTSKLIVHVIYFFPLVCLPLIVIREIFVKKQYIE